MLRVLGSSSNNLTTPAKRREPGELLQVSIACTAPVTGISIGNAERAAAGGTTVTDVACVGPQTRADSK